MRAFDYVDPFHGNGTVDTPTPKGIAAAWNWRKAQTGNTHPGATRPFGMVSVCAYSGAYPTGYGLNDLATSGAPLRIFEGKTATGFAHFQHSGVGNVEFFYNYLKVMPVRKLRECGTRWGLAQETARPGYYAATLAETGIRAELTAGRKAVMHRYTFPKQAPAVLAIDLSSGGLLLERYPLYRTLPSVVNVRRLSDRTGGGKLVFGEFPIYFHMETDLPVSECGVWLGDKIQPGARMLHMEPVETGKDASFGLYFKAGCDVVPVHLRFGFSFRSEEQARANMEEIRDLTFEDVGAAAATEWEEHLNRIQVEGGSDEQKEIFYSCLYHSLVKPADCENESPYWDGDTSFFLDFATLWDMYKTQLPLVLAVYPDRGRKLVRAMLEMLRCHGEIPNGYIMERDLDRFAGQASGLGIHTLADACFRGIESVNWREMKDLAIRALRAGQGKEFMEKGKVRPHTHTLDLACACYAMALVAEKLGDERTAVELMKHSENWRNVYDEETGLLLDDGDYYEGTLWNYSFRPHPHMGDRIALFPRVEDFVGALDTFFGYRDIESGLVDPNPDPVTFERRVRHDRFEGLNNEPDMEAPYTYIWAGRHDRTAEIVRSTMKYQYTTGPGGLPGNDDTGGLSSWYVWNALGIFPISGRDFYLIGSPLFPEATIQFARGTFRIIAEDNFDESIYVQRATLNGKTLDRAWLHISEVESGGELTLGMGPEPSLWGTAHLGYQADSCNNTR